MRKTAFTMLELIFVIVVMGILAKFGVELLKQVYDNYSRTVVATKLNQQTMNVIQQVANRLRERIPESVRLTTGGIEWIGKDVDGWNDSSWSGIADIGFTTDSNTTLIESPGTNAGYFGTSNDYALYFIQNDDIPGPGTFYVIGAAGSMHAVSGFDTSSGRNAFLFDINNVVKKASEHYVASEFAYRLDYDSTNKKLYVQSYKPWKNTAPTSFLLSDQISRFTIKNFKGNAGGFLVTVCMENKNYLGEGDYSVCKQKFIF